MEGPKAGSKLNNNAVLFNGRFKDPKTKGQYSHYTVEAIMGKGKGDVCGEGTTCQGYTMKGKY